MHLYGENIEKSFSQNVLRTNGWNLQCVIKIVKQFSYNQNFVSWNLSSLAPRFLNVFSETAWAIFIRFHMGPSFERVLPIRSTGSAPLNKMAAISIYSKNSDNILFSRTKKKKKQLWGWILVYSIAVWSSTKFVQNDDSRLTFDLFMTRSNLRLYRFVLGKSWKIIFLNMYLRLEAETYNVW